MNSELLREIKLAGSSYSKNGKIIDKNQLEKEKEKFKTVRIKPKPRQRTIPKPVSSTRMPKNIRQETSTQTQYIETTDIETRPSYLNILQKTANYHNRIYTKYILINSLIFILLLVLNNLFIFYTTNLKFNITI